MYQNKAGSSLVKGIIREFELSSIFCDYFGKNILFQLTKFYSYCDVSITEAYCGISTGTLYIWATPWMEKW